MIEFIQANWKDILEILISLILGFLGGIKYTNIKSKNNSKIVGNFNSVTQKGNEYDAKNK